MRMLVLALLVFVLAGISIGLSRLGIAEIAPRLLAGDMPEITFEVESETEETGQQIGVLRARPDGVMLLTRSSIAQTARFQLPQEAGIVSGALELNLTAQISDNQNSLLRVLVGNQTRGEVLLRPGQRDIKAEIGLTSDDLAGEALAVRYVLANPEEDGACTADGSWSNVVEIEQDSRVVLDVTEGTLTPRDQVAIWGNEVLIGWPNWLSETQRQDRWFSAIQLAQRGYNVRFVDAPDSETMSGLVLQELVDSDVPPFKVVEVTPTWPEYVADVGNNAGKRAFQRSVSWRHWYRVGPHDHQSNPSAFDYALMLGPLPNGADWTVVITHNDSIIEAKQVPGNIGRLSGTVSLTQAEITHSNVIEVTATSGYEPTGLCNNGPELFAELRPETRLVGGGAAFDGNIDFISDRLNQRQPVSIAIPENMALVEAQRMLDLAQELLPETSELVIQNDAATLKAVRRADLLDVLALIPDTAHVVWFDENDQVTFANPVSFLDDDTPVALGALALIVDTGELNRSSQLDTP